MDQILSCCESGWELGFRTFVLQGGEDPYYTDERICTITKEIKKRYPDCAVTLSIGEKERASYQRILTRGLTGICFGMRRQMRCIIRNFIRHRCHWHTEKSV